MEWYKCVFKGQTSVNLQNKGQGQVDQTLMYRARRRIRSDCEKKKTNLSQSTSEIINVDVILLKVKT